MKNTSYINYLNLVYSKLASRYPALYVSLNTKNDPTTTEIQCINMDKGYNISVESPISDIMIDDFNIAAIKTCLEVITILNNKEK